MNSAGPGALRLRKVAQPTAVVKARRLRDEIRREKRALELKRREIHQRRLVLGYATSLAGVDDFTPEEVVGLILDAKDRIADSPVLRLAVRKRGEAWLTREQQAHYASSRS